MTRLLKSPWVLAAVGMVSYLLTTGLVLWLNRDVMVPEVEAPVEEPRGRPSWEFHNPEVDQLIQELRRERETIAARQAQLDELSARLQAEKQEIAQVLQRVEQMQKQLDATLVRISTDEGSKLKKMARTYATMAPETAARVFKEMDDKSVVRIMAFMKETETAQVFEALAKLGEPQARRVADLSDQLRLVMTDPARNSAP